MCLRFRQRTPDNKALPELFSPARFCAGLISFDEGHARKDNAADNADFCFPSSDSTAESARSAGLSDDTFAKRGAFSFQQQRNMQMARSARSTKTRRTAPHTQLEALEARKMLAAHIVGSSTVYSTIQAAVNAAVAGQTITVDAGTYDETVSIYTPNLDIKGANAGVDARGTRGAESIVYATQTVFHVYSNDVTIDGFTIEGDDANIGALQGAGVLMAPSIQGTHVLNNIIQNNVTGIYLSNDSNTDACIIQHNLIQNNFEAGNNWATEEWNGSRGIYTDGTVSGGYLTNVLIDSNKLYNSNFNGGDEDEGMIALQALTAGKQFNITITNNYIGNESKALLATNVTNLVFMGNTCTGLDDGSSGPVRFEGDANTVDIQYNTIEGNSGPGVAADSSGVAGDSSGFVVDNNNIYGNDGIGVLVVASVYDGPLIAVGDWWGSTSGPGGDGPGTGQAVWANGNSGHGVTPTGAKGGGPVTFSPWATALINITAIPVPAAVTGLTASILSSSSIGLTWTPQMSTASSQLLQRSTDGINFTTIATLPPLLNSYTDSGLSGTGYYYRVIAANATGNGAASNVASTLPQAPTGLSAVALSAGRVVLNWVDSSPGIEDGFIIQRSTDGVNYTQVGTVGTGITTFTDNTALAGTDYAYRVLATSTNGNSGFSVSATTATVPVLAVATPLSSLTWTSATTGYGTIQKNLSIGGNTLTLDGQTFTTGIGTHAASTIVYNLNGAYTTFTSTVGIDDEENAGGTGSVDFQVIGDGKVLYDSGILHNRQNPGEINVSVAGVKTLTLVATNGVTGSIDYDHSDWAGAMLYTVPVTAAALIGDSGFETVSAGSAGYIYNPSGSAWAFSSASGISANASGFTSGNASAPAGSQVAFLQDLGTITQTVAGFTAGSYELSFSAAQRAIDQSSSQDFEVLVDGTVVGIFRPGSTTYQTYNTSVFSVGAGSHTIEFEGLDSNGGDNTVFLDSVALSSLFVKAPTSLTATASSSTTINLAWTEAGSGITGFIVQRSTNGTTFTTLASNVSANASTYIDSTAVSGTTYYYQVIAVSSGINSAASNIASATTISSTANTTNLSSLNWTSATTGYGSVQKNLSVNGNPITLKGIVYPSGLSANAVSNITYNLAGNYTNFLSTIGIDDEENGKGTGSVDFQVIGDGKVLFDSGVLTNSSAAVNINISVVGVQTLTLVANNGVAGTIDYDQADWAGARLLSNAVIPTAPTNLVATGIGPSLVKLTWTATSTGATSYMVQRSTNGTTFTTVATGISASATSWTDTSVLSASTKYYYQVMAVSPAGASPASNTAVGTTLALTSVTYVSNLTAVSATTGYGTVQQNLSILGNPLTLDGVTYASGIGTHASSSITYNIAGKYSTFTSTVGIDQEEDGKGNGYVDFQVFGDGVLLYDSGVLTNDQVANIDINVAGVQNLTLVANNGIANDIDYDHADWANAELLA
jgi:hypothetical protein